MGDDSVAFWNTKTRSTEAFVSGLGGASNSEWSVRSSARRRNFTGGREFVRLQKISLHFTSEI